MAKKRKDEERVERARRKLNKARMKFDVAQDEYAAARERGKQEVRAAQLRASKWQAKASAKLHAAQESVSTAEVRLNDMLVQRGEPVASPASTADVLQSLRDQQDYESSATLTALDGPLSDVERQPSGED